MNRRAAVLVAAAVVLVCAVLGVQLASGGGDFTPARAQPPCTPRAVTSVSTGIEGLGEQLVLVGLDDAACRLDVTREALALTIAQQDAPTDAQVAALHAGLLDAVDRLKAEGRLPKVSTLANEAIDQSDLNGLVKFAIKALPDSLIDKNLATDDILRRAIGKLDLRALLSNLDDPDALTKQVTKAVEGAVKDAVIARLKSLI